jgi:hypothetical protein
MVTVTERRPEDRTIRVRYLIGPDTVQTLMLAARYRFLGNIINQVLTSGRAFADPPES